MCELHIDYRKLRGRITEIFGSQKAFSCAIGMDETAISRTLNNRREFTKVEILAICKALEIDTNDIGSYFFAVDDGKSHIV